jgi:GntR family transcriptional regulator
LRRSPNLTEQVRRHLKDQILREGFADGRIPPETELAADLGVSRTTIRDALGRLESEGAIHRRQGAGTFVNHAGLQIRSPLEEIWSYEEALEAHGYTPSVQIVALDTEPATPSLAESLAIAPGDPVLVIGKVFREDGDPVVLAYNRIPEQLVQGPFTEDDCLAPIYEFLEAQCRRYLGYYLSDLVPVSAPRSVADQLKVRRGTALLSFDEIGYDRDNIAVLQATSYFRDDLLRFRLIRRQVES